MNPNSFNGLLKSENDIKSLFKIHTIRTTSHGKGYTNVNYENNGNYRNLLNKLE